MDEIDVRIIQLLEQDVHQNSETLAKQLNVSSATIRRRFKKLIDTGQLIIKAYRDTSKTGLPVSALIGLNIEHSLVDIVMKKLREQSEVSLACTTTGRFDGFILVRVRSNEDLSSFIRNILIKIEGIKDSETFIFLHLEKEGWLD